MLVRLFGKNFRSLKGKFELSLVAADLTRHEDCDRGIIDVPLAGMDEPLRLLRAVAIFGPNASGKSTILIASRALRWLATDSSGRSKPGADIPPYEPFLLDDKTRTEPIELGCDVVYRKSLLRYEITYSKKEILRETLSMISGNREDVLIERHPSGKVSGDLIVHSDANKLYVKEMQPNVGVLSKLAQHGPHQGKESVQSYYSAIRDATLHADYSDFSEMMFKLGSSDDDRFSEDPKYRKWIMNHLIRTADVGISDAHTRRERIEVPAFLKEIASGDDKVRIPDERTVVSFVHEGKNSQPINFSHESSGTRKLFNLGNDWWMLANKAVTLFADELGAGLHPRLIDRLIRSVNDSSEDRVRSQLIFTTHEVGLLESHDAQPPALRRDQVYFTKKDIHGASELYSLAEFKEDARPVHNIRKRYLSGLYGAIPSVEKLSL